MAGASDLPRHEQLEPSADARPAPGRDDQRQLDSPDRATTGSPARLQERSRRLPDGHPSSAYHADGSRKPPTVGLKELESEAEAGERADGVPDEHGLPAEGRLDEADDRASEGWRAALPRLQALWQRHTERWPAEQRTPVDRSSDEPGSWRGDAGHYLNSEENLVAEHALDRMVKAEPDVTGTMKAVETEVPGARLVGLQYCLKGENRFKEKIAEGLTLKPERAVGKEANAIPDALRYTCQLPAESYVAGCRTAFHQLQDRGYRLASIRNSWESPQYKGINTRWRSSVGQLFEVQFHTADSFEAKQVTHTAYERLRNPLTDRREMRDLQEFQREVSAQIPVPDRVSDIRDFREKGG